ncbi:N-6 DNA methylase [Nonomuraea sp. B12E4]|uniref:N-6 DNA methylase n=1 Tax=Nonomuraea sp. B12E4 TaxID=3153564 RepID=UPI00325CBF68
MSAREYLDQVAPLMVLKRGHELAKDRPDLTLQLLSDAWQALLAKDGQTLEDAYDHILQTFASREDLLGDIFHSTSNPIRDPDKLKQLIVEVDALDSGQSGTTGPSERVFKRLLALAADDDRSGLGQYYTPRAVVRAMVDCAQPGPTDIIYDPACGTGNLLLAARDHVLRHHRNDMTAEQRAQLDGSRIFGTELVAEASSLAKMNMIVHGMDTGNAVRLIEDRDATLQAPLLTPSIILANPPFGRRLRTNSIPRSPVYTRNGELNFLQHIASTLGVPGRAAVVVSDTFLFAGGAAHKVRRQLLADFDVHTLLRLPSGVFYSTAVKANVLFFDKKEVQPEVPQTSVLWVYDFRADKHFSDVRRKLVPEDLDDFVMCYRPGESRAGRVEAERFKPFSCEELMDRDQVNLDITWLKASGRRDGDSAPASSVIAREIVEDLTVALDEFSVVADLLEQSRIRSSRE